MSNKRAHRKRDPVERASYGGYSNAMGMQGDFSSYTGGRNVTIPTNVLMAMLQNMGTLAGVVIGWLLP